LSATLAVTAGLSACLALVPTMGIAQTPSFAADSSVDALLQPALDGNPARLPRFRRTTANAAVAPDQAPPTAAFTTPSRIGATPVYGSPTGFGAGDTGYDSTNTKSRKKPVRAPATTATVAPPPETTFDEVPALTPQTPPKPFTPAPPPLPQIYPAKAASRAGAALPQPSEPLPVNNPPPEVHPLAAANRPGGVLPVPQLFDVVDAAATPPPGAPLLNTAPIGTVPQRPLPIAGGDPYAALGIRAGSFLLFPSIDLSAGHDANPAHTPGGNSSPFFIAAPELLVQSDWSRHSLTADIRGSYTYYSNDLVPSLNRPDFNSKIDGRIDVTRQTQILLENRYIVSTDNPGSPNLQAGLAKLPIDNTVGGTVGVAQQFNRFDVSLKGTLDRSTYNNSLLTDGETSTNDDRNFNQYAGILRLGYDMDPALKPFVEVSDDTRVHDLQFDRNDLQRDSRGVSAKVGGDFDMFGSLTGEIAVGYMERIYQDPTLPTISGAVVDGSLIWQATALTTAKFTAASVINESILPGVSGSFSRDYNLQVDHALRTWLIATLTLGYGRDAYVGSIRDDDRYFASFGLTYKMTRELQLKTEVRQDWLSSTEGGVAYTATSYLLGLRLQR
jgi:hypothetical protein